MLDKMFYGSRKQGMKVNGAQGEEILQRCNFQSTQWRI